MDRRADFGYSARRNSVVAKTIDTTVDQGRHAFGDGDAFDGRTVPFNPFDKDKGQDVQVLVRDNNVDQALRALKKKLQREGVFREMKLRDHYEKPSEKRAREKAEAVRRARKVARKRAQRDGLLPVKAKPAR